MFLKQRLGLIRMGTEGEDFELKQMKDMAAARKRWEALVWSIISCKKSDVFLNFV